MNLFYQITFADHMKSGFLYETPVSPLTDSFESMYTATCSKLQCIKSLNVARSYIVGVSCEGKVTLKDDLRSILDA